MAADTSHQKLETLNHAVAQQENNEQDENN